MKYVPPIGGAANDPYVDVNPGAGIAGSLVSGAAIERPQREIVAVIAAAGIAPADGDLTQLLQAIRVLAEAPAWVAHGNTGAALGLDFSTGSNFTATASANFTLSNPTNALPGQKGFIEITQDGAGGRTITYGANFIAPGGVRPALSIAPGARDLISYVVAADGKIYFALNRSNS